MTNTNRDRLKLNQEVAFKRNKANIECRIPSHVKYHLARICYEFGEHVKANGWRGAAPYDISHVSFDTHAITLIKKDGGERVLEAFESGREMFSFVQGYITCKDDTKIANA